MRLGSAWGLLPLFGHRLDLFDHLGGDPFEQTRNAGLEFVGLPHQVIGLVIGPHTIGVGRQCMQPHKNVEPLVPQMNCLTLTIERLAEPVLELGIDGRELRIASRRLAGGRLGRRQ
jgi:hypothetical protein